MSTRYQGSVIISSLILTLVVGILLSLGMWQLSRMNEKQLYLADIEAKMQNPAQSLTDFVQADGYGVNTPVRLSGSLANDFVWYLENQPFDGVIGYHVYAPLRTSVGDVLVNLGWIAAPPSRSEWPFVVLPEAIEGEVGVVTQPSKNPFIDESVFETYYSGPTTQFRVQALDIQLAAEQAGLSLLPFTVTLTDPSEAFKRQWQPVVMPPQKHMGYAIQWFGLALAAFIIGAIAIYKARKTHGEI